MFCIHCGKQIADSARFCAFCGAQKNSSQNTMHNFWNNNQNIQQLVKPNFQKKYEYSKEKYTITIVQIILLIVITILDIVFIFTIDNWGVFKNGNGTVKFGSYNTEMKADIFYMYLKWFLAIEAGYNIIAFVLKIIKASTIKGTYLFISKSGIYGVGGTDSYLLNKEINLKYNEINMVRVKSGYIIIRSGSKYYKLFLDGYDLVATEIVDRVQVARARALSML